jgi:hypothetical protein
MIAQSQAQVVRQRDELRIRIQHLLHILQDSQTAYEEQTKENEVLRHALSQGIGTNDSCNAVPAAISRNHVCLSFDIKGVIRRYQK